MRRFAIALSALVALTLAGALTSTAQAHGPYRYYRAPVPHHHHHCAPPVRAPVYSYYRAYNVYPVPAYPYSAYYGARGYSYYRGSNFGVGFSW